MDSVSPANGQNRTNSAFNLLVPAPDGKPPQARLDDIQSALGVASTLLEATKERWRKMAMLRGMVDGNPPFNPGKLRSAGMAYYPNFSTLEGKAYVSSALVPYYDLFAGSPSYIDIQLDLKDKQVQDEASRVVCEEADRVFRYAEWFESRLNKMLFDFVTFGKGFLMWPDPDTSLRFRHIPAHRVLFPDGEDVDYEDWNLFGVLQTLKPDVLFGKVRNREAAERAGWNWRAVMEAIALAAPYDPSIYDDYVGLQDQLRDHDLYVTARSETIWVMNLYVREFNRRWTHLIVPMDSYRGGGAQASMPFVPLEQAPGRYRQPNLSRLDELHRQGFLFKKVGRFAAVENILCPFFFELMSGSVNGLSGLGKDIFAPMQLKDRMWCSRINNTFMRSSIVLQPRDAKSREQLQIMQMQNVTILPPGVEVQNGTIFGDLAAAEETSAGLDRLLQQNTGIYRPTFEKPPGNPEPAANFRMRAAQSTTLSNSAVNRFVKQGDRLFAELFRRLQVSSDLESRAYRQACEDRGITKEMQAHTRYVRMYRPIGAGSVFLRNDQLLMLLSPAANIFANLPADGQAALVQDAIGSMVGQQKVERYAPFTSRKSFANRDAWEAQQENDAMQTGGPVIAYPEQNDQVHLAVHAQAGQQALASLTKGAQPMLVAAFMPRLLQHAQVHLQNLARNKKKAELKAFGKIFAALGAQTKQLTQAVMKQQQQVADQRKKQQQLTADQQLKAAKVKADLQLRTLKTRHGMALKEAQARQGMALADAQTAAEMHRRNLKMFESPEPAIAE